MGGLNRPKPYVPISIPQMTQLPSGKRLHNYGKSAFLMEQLTIYKWKCSIAMLVYQRVCR